VNYIRTTLENLWRVLIEPECATKSPVADSFGVAQSPKASN